MKARLHNFLNKHAYAKSWLSRCYRWRLDYWRPLPGDLKRLLQKRICNLDDDSTIIQIGSNDGISGDPLYDLICDSEMRSILVEPVPHLFKLLKTLHEPRKHVTCVNAAISSTEHALPFYVVDNKNGYLPSYFDQLGSFNRATIEKQKRDYPQISNHILELTVPCMTLRDLQTLHDVKRADFIHVDAEGYDLNILKSIDLDEISNTMLLFEHVHIEQSDYRSYLKQLKSLGYKTRDCGADTIAWRNVA
jgi:FkbM family methyltransferase